MYTLRGVCVCERNYALTNGLVPISQISRHFTIDGVQDITISNLKRGSEKGASYMDMIIEVWVLR